MIWFVDMSKDKRVIYGSREGGFKFCSYVFMWKIGKNSIMEIVGDLVKLEKKNFDFFCYSVLVNCIKC